MTKGLRVHDMSPIGERPADLIRGRVGIQVAGVGTILGSQIVGSPNNNDILVYDSTTDTWTLVDYTTLAGGTSWQNATAFGAVGDGTTDDAAAIQAAIDAACTAGGGVVYLPTATYAIGTTLTVTCDGVTILGDGNAASVILAVAGLASSDMIQISGNRCGVAKLELTSTAIKSGGSGLYITGNNATLTELSINHQYDAVKISGSSIVRFLDSGITDTSRHGLWIAGSGNDYYLSHLVMDNAVTASGNGIYLSAGAQAIFAENCDILHFSNGLLMQPSATSTWHFFTGCAFDTCSNDTIHLGGGAASLEGVTFVNCWGASAGASGVYIDTNVETVTFSSGKVLNNGQHGFRIASSSASHITIADNAIVSNGQSSSNTYDGISVAAGVLHLGITGNHAYNGLGLGSTQRYGLSFASGATDYLVLDSNDFSGNATGAISNLAGVSGTHQMIDGGASTAAGTTGQVWTATTGSLPSWQTLTAPAPTAAQVRDAGRWEPTVDDGTDTLIFDAHTVVMDWTTT